MGSMPGTISPIQACLNSIFVNDPGAVSYPSDWLYKWTAVKGYNIDISVTPAAVARPSTAEEVSRIVQCAVASSLKVQARSGGHGYANYCLGGESGAVVVDMANFQHFSMNRTNWYATFGSGTLLGDLSQQLYDNGKRVIAHGTCPQVGTGGHLTVGGLGPLSRLYGTALDHVEEVEVVLANGAITRASASQNKDIFFAMRGAAASFGIVTEFVVHTEPAPGEFVQYSYYLQVGNKSSFASTFAAWQDIIKDPRLDRKFASQVVIMEFGMLITGTYFGTKDEYDALDFGARLKQSATSVYTFPSILDKAAHWAENEVLKLVGSLRTPFYSKNLAFTADTLIPDSGIQNMFHYLDTAEKGTKAWFVIFDLQGGKINDVPVGETAFAHRNALFYMQTYALGLFSLSDTSRAFLNGIDKVIKDSMPGVNFGAYPGYVDPALPDGQKRYWGPNLPRLERIKAKIDPNDVFHNPQSVRPAKTKSSRSV